MRLFSTLFFLTFVAGGPVLAAPNAAMPPPERKSSEPVDAPESFVPSENVDGMGLAEPEGAPLDPADLRRPPTPRRSHSDWQWQVQLGLLGGQLLHKDQTENATYLGGTAIWTPRPESSWDFSTDVTNNNLVRLGVGRRRAFETDTQYEPYWKIGFTQTLEASRFASALVDLERVKVMAGVGLGDLFESDGHWAFEAAIGWGLNGFATAFQFGYRW